MFAGQAEVVDLVNGSGIMNPLLARMTGGPISHRSCGVSLRSDVRVLTGGGLRPW